MRDKIELHHGYSSSVASYVHLDEVVGRAVDDLANVDFDTLVGRGMSGAVIIPLLASRLQKNFLLIRKDGDGAHTSAHVGNLGRRWIFVDDFVSTGNTREIVRERVQEIVDEDSSYREVWDEGSQSYIVRESDKFTTTYVGDYLYADYSRRWKPYRPL